MKKCKRSPSQINKRKKLKNILFDRNCVKLNWKLTGPKHWKWNLKILKSQVSGLRSWMARVPKSCSTSWLTSNSNSLIQDMSSSQRSESFLMPPPKFLVLSWSQNKMSIAPKYGKLQPPKKSMESSQRSIRRLTQKSSQSLMTSTIYPPNTIHMFSFRMIKITILIFQAVNPSLHVIVNNRYSTTKSFQKKEQWLKIHWQANSRNTSRELNKTSSSRIPALIE